MFDETIRHGDTHQEYVTVMLGPQLFGLPISRVQDVFMLDKITRRAAGGQQKLSACSICAGGSSPRLTCAVVSVCRLLKTTSIAMRWASSRQGEAYGLVIDLAGRQAPHRR